jgi:hypothetical protein
MDLASGTDGKIAASDLIGGDCGKLCHELVQKVVDKLSIVDKPVFMINSSTSYQHLFFIGKRQGLSTSPQC